MHILYVLPPVYHLRQKLCVHSKDLQRDLEVCVPEPAYSLPGTEGPAYIRALSNINVIRISGRIIESEHLKLCLILWALDSVQHL